MQSETFWAYFAGIVDGEGCFQLMKNTNQRIKVGFQWRPELDIGNRKKELLEYILRESQSGNLIKTKREGKEFYILRFHSGSLRYIIPKLAPFLILKKEQSELLFEALKLLDERRHSREKRWNRDVKVDQRLEEIRAMIVRQHLGNTKKVYPIINAQR